jgi:tetratricopeptide (TPR) repeat protein
MGQELTGEQINLHNQLYQEGLRLIEGEIHIHDRPPVGKPGWLTRRKLRKAISLFERTLEINPANWSAMWVLGKVYQRMGGDVTALEWFTKARQIERTNPDVVREAALCALNLGRTKEAVELTATAIELKPDDPGLVANHALALLLDNRPQEAKDRADEAVNADPSDAVSRSVLQFIKDVISGRKQYPKSFKDVR